MTALERAREALMSVAADDMPVAMYEVEEAIAAFEKAVRAAQAQADAELMEKMATNVDKLARPTTRPSADDTIAVYRTAADALHPDRLGWSLNLPDHLRDVQAE
jgi:hypothetical protein